LFSDVTFQLHLNQSYETRAIVRCLLKHLEEIQGIFVTMLAYPKCRQLTRECCCLGLAACRGLLQATHNNLLDESVIHQKLLTAFGQTTSYGGSAMMETSAQAAARRATNNNTSTSEQSSNTIMEQFGDEPDVGGVAGMGEAVLGAYREMAAASVSLGRQDILYALLMLSVSHVYWSTGNARHLYNAQSLLGDESDLGKSSSLAELRAALRPSFNRILPRILRACNDPNKQTREQMHSLWLGLTGGGADARQVITNNLLPIVDSLLVEASGKLWRTRVGACGALSELIVGREWSALGGGGVVLSDEDLFDSKAASAGIRLLKLWRVVVRALDDVHGAVRTKGETLARAVRALTVRLCNPSPPDKPSGHKRTRDDRAKYELEAAAAAGTSLRWLLKHGLNQSDAEATGICMSTLVELVGVVKPKILEPSVPDLLRSLLLATSNLEPSVLNYLQFRTSDQETTERTRLQIAQSGPIALAVSKCVELIPFVSLDTQKHVAPELEAALRLSTGFATRVAVADAVSTLCSICPAVFTFASATISNPSVRLLRSFYFACERERGAASIDKMIHALGNLASLCPGRSVRSLAVRACNRYRESTGNYDDVASRKAAALALRALAVRASNHFSDGGKNEIWERFVLPAAYLGRKDPDSKIANLFTEVWEEGGNATKIVSESTEKFGGTLEENLLPFLVHECILALQDVSWGRRVAGAAALGELCSLGVLGPLKSSATKHDSTDTFGNKQRAKVRAKSCHKALNQCIELLARPRIWKGKSSVTKAVSSMTASWVSAISNEKFDQMNLFGCEDAIGLCPWQPILVQPSEHSDDLFLGDKWFALPASIDEQEEGEEVAYESVSNDDKVTGQPIDTMPEIDELEIAADHNTATETLNSDNASIDSNILTFIGLRRFLVGQGFPTSQSKQNETEESLPYRTASLRAFQDIMNSLACQEQHVRSIIFNVIACNLLDTCTNSNDGSTKASPVIIAAALDAINSCFWQGIGKKLNDQNHPYNFGKFVAAMKDVGGKNQVAWTVRESSALAIGKFASLCHVSILRHSTTLMTMIEASFFALTDPKFWRVRYATTPFHAHGNGEAFNLS
jgi:proteasome component ECM29